MKRVSLLAVVLLMVLGLGALSKGQNAGTTETKVVKSAAVNSASVNSGRELFAEHCAACHGKEAKGNGPAAAELKVPPPDLTGLAKNNNGKYPASHVAEVLRSGVSMPAHGSSEMPVWGKVLGTSAVHGTDQAKVQQRILALSDYLESLQVK